MTQSALPSHLLPSSSAADEPATDAQLMAAVQTGDRLAFSELYDRYAASVLGLCRQILQNPSEAEVVVSDVFWEIWQKAQRFDPLKGSWQAYLYTLARSRAIDRRRASTTRRQKTTDAAQLQPQQQGAQPHHELLAGERQQMVREALDQLGSQQREALQLAYFEGLTHGEISHRLDRPLGTVKTHIRRGLETLKTVLKNLGGPDELS